METSDTLWKVVFYIFCFFLQEDSYLDEVHHEIKESTCQKKLLLVVWLVYVDMK